jgi:chaperonin GroES
MDGADDILGGLPAEGEPAPAEGISAPAVAPNLMVTNKLLRWSDHKSSANIATELDDDTLGKIGQACRREYDIDVNSRATWVENTKDAMDLAMQVAKTKSYPWPNASNVIYPLMTVAAIEFHARAYPAIVAGRNVVKGVVIGADDGVPLTASDGQPAVEVQMGPTGPVPIMGPDGQPVLKWKVPPGEKRRRADRIGEHMSWQCVEQMEEWEEETDKLLIILPIAGCMFRKSYFDPGLGRNVAVLANSMNVVINYWAKSLGTAPRISEEIKLYPVEIKESELNEIFLKHEYGTATGANGDDDAPHEFIEQHRRWDLDGDDYPEPYIVTIHKATGKVARICARYEQEDVTLQGVGGQGTVRAIRPTQYYTKYDFLPNIEGGIYGMGFGQLLRPINTSINTTLNMLFDAGHRQIVGGGFIGKGLSMHSGQVKFKMGTYTPVNAPGSVIRDAIVDVQSPEPSAVMFALLGKLEEAGNRIGSIKDVLTGEAAMATMQPTTLLALIDQGTKVFTGIYKRVYRSAKREFDKLYRLNRVYGEEIMSYQVGDEWKQITREDYARGSGVAPYSDPQMVNDMQRLARAGFLQGYQNDAHCDPIEIRTRIFDAAQMPDKDKLFAKQQGPTPDAIMAAAKIENESIKTRAAAIKDLSAAVKNLAEADATVGAQALAFVGQQFEILKHQLERLDDPAAQGQADPTAGHGQGDRPGGVQQLAGPSSDQAGAGLSDGLPPGA